MSSITGEHNCLERNAADQIAKRLHSLFYNSGDNPPPLPANFNIDSPNLVEALDQAPLRIIEFCSEGANVYAVDGGSSVLARGGNIEVIAWRAGMVRFQDNKRLIEYCRPPEIVAYNRLTALDILSEYIVDLEAEYISDRPPVKLVDDLRWLAEWRLINDIIDNGEAGSLLLIDGSLRSHPSFNCDFQKSLLRRAVEKHIYMAAVTKKSSLSLDGLPLDFNLGQEKNTALNHGCWYRQLNRPLKKDSGWLGNIFLAGFHPAAAKPYRVDINRFDEQNTDKIFSMIISVSDDVEFCGYPYPLTAAHRLARIDNLFREELSQSIGQALERREFPPRFWKYLSGDIHDKLNADLMARV